MGNAPSTLQENKTVHDWLEKKLDELKKYPDFIMGPPHYNFDNDLISSILNFIQERDLSQKTEIDYNNTGERINIVINKGIHLENYTFFIPLTFPPCVLVYLLMKFFPGRYKKMLIKFPENKTLDLKAPTLESVGLKRFSTINIIDLSILESASTHNFPYYLPPLGDSVYCFRDGNDVHLKVVLECEQVPFHKYRGRKTTANGMEIIKSYAELGYFETFSRMTFPQGFYNEDGTEDTDFINRMVAMYNTIYESIQFNLPNKVFRCVYLSKIELQFYKDCVDKHIYLTTFTSTSRRIAQSFYGEGKTIMVFLLKPKDRDSVMDVREFSKYDHEEEILINPCTKCLVKRVDETGINPVIFLEFGDMCCWSHYDT